MQIVFCFMSNPNGNMKSSPNNKLCSQMKIPQSRSEDVLPRYKVDDTPQQSTNGSARAHSFVALDKTWKCVYGPNVNKHGDVAIITH